MSGTRVLWALIGLVLLAAGVLGALASQGWLGVDRATTLITPQMAERWRGWGGWASAVAIAAGLLLALLGGLLLASQVRRRRGVEPDLPMSTSDTSEVLVPPVGGRTRVAAPALHHALTRDVQRYPEVDRAAVHLSGGSRWPEVHVRLAVASDADLTDLRDHLYQTMGRLVSTTGLPASLTEVEVTRI